MSRLPIELFVDGFPAPQGSKRHVGGGRYVEDSKYVKPWRDTIHRACEDQGIGDLHLAGPLRVSLIFSLPRPKAHLRANGALRPDAPTYPTGKPDIDKLARAVHDALATDAHVIADDSHIVKSRLEKRYGTVPGVLIVIDGVKP